MKNFKQKLLECDIKIGFPFSSVLDPDLDQYGFWLAGSGSRRLKNIKIIGKS
jgi:hypothetical protein